MQKAALLREMRVRPKIGEHDLEAKIRLIRKLLEEGDKVKVAVFFRGREITHPEVGWKVLQRIAKAIEGTATIEESPTPGRGTMYLLISPATPKKDKEPKVEVEAEKEIQDAKA